MNPGSFVPILVAVQEQRKEKVINYLKENKALDKKSAVNIEDSEILAILNQYKSHMSYIHCSDGNYWFNKEEYETQRSKAGRATLIVLIIGLIVLVLLIWLFSN